MSTSSETYVLLTKATIPKDKVKEFLEWQSHLRACIELQEGFLDVEIRYSKDKTGSLWTIAQRFSSFESVSQWRSSSERKGLLERLKQHGNIIQEEELDSFQRDNNVTEVFVTEVLPEMETAYHEWLAKIHALEITFPGFQNMRGHLLHHPNGHKWVTFLQFDTSENLDRWIFSEERKRILSEAALIVSSCQSHRIFSPFTGWFQSIERNGFVMPTWKQAMVVLLVLFPIVMLELKYLSPVMTSVNSSVATFIGNAISVALISWPMMPIALWALDWWASSEKSLLTNMKGVTVIVALYLLEIGLFWDLI